MVPSIKFTLIAWVAIIGLGSLSFVLKDKKRAASIHYFNLEKNGLAIKGYDPVSYFSGKKAEEGKKGITLTTEGITYRFTTTQDRDLFKANAAKHQWQYGK